MPTKISQPTEPHDLACALFILEGEKYTSILPADCISHLRGESGNNNIKLASDTNNKIINWVKQGILRQDDLDTRTQVLKFFVNTAEVFRFLIFPINLS